MDYCKKYEKMDKLSMSMIVMRPDWLIVKSDEWEGVLWTSWKGYLGLFNFGFVYSYVTTYLISDMVLDYDSLSMFRRVFTFVGGFLVVNRMDRSMLSWQNRILVWVGRFRDSGFDVVLGWWKVFGSFTSVILLLERYREATVCGYSFWLFWYLSCPCMHGSTRCGSMFRWPVGLVLPLLELSTITDPISVFWWHP